MSLHPSASEGGKRGASRPPGRGPLLAAIIIGIIVVLGLLVAWFLLS